MDIFATIQTATIMEKHRRSRMPSGKESLWTSTRRLTLGEISRRGSDETAMGENTRMGMSICPSPKAVVSISVRRRLKDGWKERKFNRYVETDSPGHRLGTRNGIGRKCLSIEPDYKDLFIYGHKIAYKNANLAKVLHENNLYLSQY